MLSMMAMAALGLGEICGAIFMGIVVDKIGTKDCSLINVGLVLIQTASVFTYIIIGEYSILAFVMTFLWGF